jgi:serine/threonine protein kinase
MTSSVPPHRFGEMCPITTISKSTPLPCIVGNYDFRKLIGHGGFAEVFLVSHVRFEAQFVAKVMTFDTSELDEKRDVFESEIHALLKLNHSNIIRMYDHFDIGVQFFLILEYCPGGSLRDEILEGDGLIVPRFMEVATQVIDALAYCHSHNIAHRDIKPGNILLDQHRDCKIADFGLCMATTAGRKLRQFGGSIMYTAPEIAQKKAHDPMAADVWALGVVLTMMITGTGPFKCDCLGELRQLSAQGAITFKRPVPPPIEELIRHMIVVDPDARLTMAQVRSHKLFREDVPRSTLRILDPGIVHWNRIRRLGRESDEGDEALHGLVGCDLESRNVTDSFVISASVAMKRCLRESFPMRRRAHSLRSTPHIPDSCSTFPDEICEVNAAGVPCFM